MHKVRFERIKGVEFMYYWDSDSDDAVDIYGRMNCGYAWEYLFGLPCIQDFTGNPVVYAIDLLKEKQFDYELQN